MSLVRHSDVAAPGGDPAVRIAASYLGSGYRDRKGFHIEFSVFFRLH
jgi:hypothetical protein